MIPLPQNKNELSEKTKGGIVLKRKNKTTRYKDILQWIFSKFVRKVLSNLALLAVPVGYSSNGCQVRFSDLAHLAEKYHRCTSNDCKVQGLQNLKILPCKNMSPMHFKWLQGGRCDFTNATGRGKVLLLVF